MGETLKAAGLLAGAEELYVAALANPKGTHAERRVIMAETLIGYADLLRKLDRTEERLQPTLGQHAFMRTCAPSAPR